MAFKKIGLFHKRQIDVSLPPLFVFDEPTGSLDNEYRNCFLSFLMDKYAKRAFTALIITHDYSIISEIYRSYSAYKDRIRFMELSKAGAGEVRLNDFSAGRYFGWLEAKKAIDAAPAGKPVCTISPHLKIFGRSLCIYSDAGRTVSAPLVIRQGEIVYVKAPSGMGKTTLAKVIMGLYKADEFTMSLCGIDISAATEMKLWRQRIWGKLASMAFQHADEAMDLESTVNETFAGLSSRVKGDTSSIIKELFDPATVKSIINRKVKYLSGGQKQRLNLLRTLVLDASLTILDEPLSALDFDSIQKVLDLLETKRAAGGAFLMISHNEEIFESIIPPQNIFYLGERKNADA
jgi:peptide/nickel transport system ATP-binding protein